MRAIFLLFPIGAAQTSINMQRERCPGDWPMRAKLLILVAGFAAWAICCQPELAADQRPLAPAPRATEETTFTTDLIKRGVYGPETKEAFSLYGVEWHVNTEIRRLVSTGRNCIALKWSLHYTGRRPPLIIRKPSLVDGLPDDAYVWVYALPKGKERGRKLCLTCPEPTGLEMSKILHEGYPISWWLEVPKGETERGIEYVEIAALKDKLISRYPNEFKASEPPELFVNFVLDAQSRGWGAFDAWTGELGTNWIVQVPQLKSW
jgi:hypothetical protein